MPRPTDWDALGLGSDPTPGDPDRLDQLARSMAELGGVARDIDDALIMVLNKTGDGAWMGQTAEALREKIEGPLRAFVRSIAEAFEGSSQALVFYSQTMREQQARADGALSQGRGLTSETDRPQRDEHAATAEQAGTAMAEAAASCAATVSAAARGIKQPVSDCELFWEAFKWLAIALIVPALLLGGPVALFAIGVNLTLFIKTAVDFSQGKAGLLDLFLAGLGMIAPTTKALPIFRLIGAAAKFTWSGLKAAGIAGFNFFRGLLTGGAFRGVTILPGVRNLASLAGSWVRSGSLWVLAPLTRMPSFTALVRTTGIVAIDGLRAVPGVIRALPGAYLRGAATAWRFSGDVVNAGLNLGGRALGATWNFAVSQLGGARFLRLLLPVDAGEIGRFGLREALRLGFVERGLMARNVFGAPLTNALGRTAAAVPPPPVQHVSSLLDLPRPDLIRFQLGDFSGMKALDLHAAGPAGHGIGLAAPTSFHVSTAFGDGLRFGPDAVRRLDALLDTPVHELNAVRVGDWAAPGLGADASLGISTQAGNALTHGPAFAGAQSLHVPGLNATSVTHAPLPQVTAGVTHAGVPGTSVNNALDLLLPSSMNRADAPVFGTGAHLSEPATQAKSAHDLTLHLDEYGPARFDTTRTANVPAQTAPPSPVTSLTAPPSPVTSLTALPPSATSLTAPPPSITSLTTPSPSAVSMAAPPPSAVSLAAPPPSAGYVAPPSPPASQAPVTGVSVAASMPPGADRVTSALNLLDNGRGIDSPALAGAPGQSKGLAAATPPPAVAAASSPPPPVAAVSGPPPTAARGSGPDIQRLWNEDADAVHSVFGHAGDPARPERIQAWREYVQARGEQASAGNLVRNIDSLIGSGSTPSPLHLQARQALDAADVRAGHSLDRLTALGLDPARIDRQLTDLASQSIHERPRLIAGTTSDTPPALPPHTPPGPPPHAPQTPPGLPPHTPDAPVPPGALEAPVPAPALRLPGDAGRIVPDGPGRFVLTDAHGTHVPGHTVTRTADGFRVESPDGAYRVFDPDTGRLTQTATPLRDPAGSTLGQWLHTQDGAPTRIIDANGTPIPHLTTTQRPNGLHQITNTTDGTFTRHTPDGTHVETGSPLRAPDGTPNGTNAVFGHDTTIGRLENGPDHGLPITRTADGLRVESPDGAYRVFDPDTGRLTQTATPLRDPAGNTLGQWLHTQDGAPTRIIDANGTPIPHLTTTQRPNGLHQITNTTDSTFTRHTPDGTHVETGRPFPDGTYAVFGHNTTVGRLESATGDVIPGRTVTALDGGSLRVAFEGGARHGEFRIHAADGTLTHSGFNVLKKGLRTDFQYVVDHAGETWTRQPHPNATVTQTGTGMFHHGRARFSAGGDEVRLFSSTGNPVEVFSRRPYPGGGVLDAFRSTDTVAFTKWSRTTTWARWDDSGAMVAHGERQYDTSGFAWKDVDSRGNVVHQHRDGLNKGDILAVKEGGEWRWHRFDASGQELAQGVRKMDRDGGWTDTLTGGAVVQRQWGPAHLPQVADQYREYGWDAARGTPADTWKSQSKQGKDVGVRQRLTDGGVLTTTRWSEQRPPLWARKALVHAAPPEDLVRHLKTDNRFQIFTWTKEGGTGPGGGVRYVGMDGRYFDLDANGRLTRFSGKLPDGKELKVGDLASRPGYDPAHASHLPWQAGDVKGYRVPLDGPGPAWQDRFLAGPDGEWRVAREGFADGSVRDYQRPPRVNPATGELNGADVPWIQRDAHGNLVGEQHLWTGPDGIPHRIKGSGPMDSATWRWESAPLSGGPAWAGRRVYFRGSDDIRLPWDDSFRDLDATGALVRERDMLGDGKYVESWRALDPATGQERWVVEKFDASGNRVPFGDGDQVRQWWNPDTRAWGDQRVGDAAHFRDVLRGGERPVVLREVPPHLSAQDGPLRVREYVPGGGQAGTPGAWKEFDHGAVVRERTALPDGTFLEKDAWRGQWRKYDAAGDLIAQRTDRGLVWEQGSGGWRLTGDEYDFRGRLADLRGWGRGLREANRLPWDGSVKLDSELYRNALDGVPGLPQAHGGSVSLGEAAYQSYAKVLAQKVLIEFGQEFMLEFGANLAANGIVAAIQNKPFTGQDVLKSFANAAVTATVKTGIATGMHEVRGARWGQPKSVLANLDSGKHPQRRPFNHEKTWANEWAGNANPVRWRGGTYDFSFNAGVGAFTGWVNGSMNAAVWGVTGADGKTHLLTGGDAVLDGAIAGLGGLVSAGGTAVARNLFMMGGGGRFFHRQGFAEFWVQLPFKVVEKFVNSAFIVPGLRAAFNPPYVQGPPPDQQQQ